MRALLIILSLCLTSAPAWAQSLSVMRGEIVSISGDGVIAAKTRAGEPATVRLKPDARVIAVLPASLEDLRQNAYIGVAAVPQADGQLRALEVHIFPEALRGAGDGHRAFDLAPGSTMTNGNLSIRVEAVDGPKITVAYAGGEKTILIDHSTKIVTFAPGERAELKPGAEIIARGQKADDGAIEAQYVNVGRGVVPPM